MIRDGWFPFIEILPDYKNLSEIYENKFDMENQIQNFVNNFSKKRIEKMVLMWWTYSLFNEKKPLIEAGIDAYLQNTQYGFINCTKTLSSEIEGILRKIYHFDTGKGNKVKTNDFISHVIQKATIKTGSDFSLFLSVPPKFKYQMQHA